MANRTRIFLMTRARFRSGDVAARVLDALAARPELAPTSWGEDDQARLPFDRARVLESLAAQTAGFYLVVLRRAAKIAYEAVLQEDFDRLRLLRFELRGALKGEALRAVFELGEELAGILAPVFGGVHPVSDAAPPAYALAARITPKELETYGPRALCARTWLGEQLVERIGRERLEASGADLATEPWGGARVDLVPEPWTADLPTLAEHQGAIMDQLVESGAFGDYRQSFKYAPGPAWRPIST